MNLALRSHDPAPILIPTIGLEVRVRIASAHDGVLTMIETTNAPSFGPPLHRHRQTEIFYVLEGRYLFEVDGRRFQAETGDVVTAPGGVAHAFVNVGDRPARQLVQILPTIDAVGFFTELGDAMAEADRGLGLTAFGLKWGVEFLGPPLTVATPDR